MCVSTRIVVHLMLDHARRQACLITHPISARSLLILISSTPAVVDLEFRRLLAEVG